MEISVLLDKGEIISLKEVSHHIEEMDLIDWLEQKYPYDKGQGLDLSLLNTQFRQFFQEKILTYRMSYGGDESRKWGVKQNGLCLLICWASELTRDIHLKFIKIRKNIK
jgi:hypothetical protein